MSVVSVLLLIVFAISILITYMIVRRTQVRIIIPLILGSVADVIIFALYSLSAGNLPIQAALVGLVLGILFNVMTVAAASFFRQNTSVRAQE